MKKYLALGALALVWAGSAQAATTVDYAAGSVTLPTGVSVFQNFDGFAPDSVIGNNAFARANIGKPNEPGYGSAGLSGLYGVVGTGGSYTTSFGISSMFSFLLGSLDTFNSLTLRYADGSSQLYQGGQITKGLSFNSGSQITGGLTGVVTYRVSSGPLLTGATFASTGSGFEFDNLAAAVPEPATWGMMILGFGLVGGAMRRRPKTTVRFA
jgi:hypothetical protein